jgi:hypothetical protein
MSKAVYKIYALIDPITDVVRYIGKTQNPLSRRLRDHIRIAKKGRPKTEKKDWINNLSLSGLKPKIKLIETCDKLNWRDREFHWSKQFPSLLNYYKAGGGSDGERVGKIAIESVKGLLGVISDSRIAEKIGTTRKTISYYREQLCIPAAKDTSRKTPPPPMGGHNKITISDEIITLFGTMPDYKIAALIGVTKSCITRRRNSLGIKSYAETTGNNGKIKVGEPHRRWT